MNALTVLRCMLRRPIVCPLCGHDIRVVLAFGMAAILLLSGGYFINHRIVDQLLQSDAERTAIALTEALDERMGDDLALLLQRRVPGPSARSAIELARRFGVMRFKLYDTMGELVFICSDLESPDTLGATLASHRGSSDIAARVLAGGNYVVNFEGMAPPEPSFYSETYIPIRRGQSVIGVAEAYVDQSTKAEYYHAALRIGAFLLVGLVPLTGILPGFVVRLIALDRRAAEERAQYLAIHDPLTGLPNRRRLTEVVALAASRVAGSGEPVALLMIDLDRFKPVNDLHGHATGDALLQEVAKRLREVSRERDFVARLGGDEFAILAEVRPDDPSDDAARLARRIVAALERPFAVAEVTVQIGCSVGVALAPQDADKPGRLMERADLALYRAKMEGRGCYRFFEQGMDERVRERARLEADLRVAIAQDSLVPYFQPLVDMSNGRLIGFEMLARWRHPVRGDISPATFIPIAEDTGMIVPMSERLIRKACLAAAEWPEDLTVAVNVSPLQLRDRALPETIRSVLAESGLAARRLEIELTESALIGNFALARDIVAELKEIGVRLALDDFGTGYSSLAHLQALPFDKLKIDAGFVRSMMADTDSRKIVAAVVGLGHSLGLPTLAEGIEATRQAELLQELGCDMGQGWLYGKPMSGPDARELIASIQATSGQDGPVRLAAD